MSVLRTGLFSLVVLLASGLAGARELPEWALAAPELGETLTAVGTGTSVASAKQDAVGVLLHTLSSTVSSQNQLHLSNRDGQSKTEFVQTVSSKSFQIDLENVDVDLNYADPQGHVVRIALARQLLVQSLRDRLQTITAITLPESSPRQRFLWALQYRDTVEEGLRYARVLAALGEHDQHSRQHLEALNTAVHATASAASVRLLAGSDLEFLTPTLSRQFPAGGHDLLWLKANVRRFSGGSSGDARSRLVVTLQLMSSESPFQVFTTSELIAEGAGATATEAEQRARDSLVAMANQPLADWFFE